MKAPPNKVHPNGIDPDYSNGCHNPCFWWNGNRWWSDDLVRLFEKAAATSPGLLYRQEPAPVDEPPAGL